jgi:nitroreductase
VSEIGLYEAMSTLRAVRRLRPDPIPADALERVLEAASWAPTGGNVQPWRVVVVEEAAAKKRLQELYAPEWERYCDGYKKRLTQLPEAEKAALRAAGNDLSKAERTLAAGDYLAANLAQAPAVLVFCFAPDRMAITDADLDRPSIVGGASVYTAVENALLACRAEGLGCVLTTLLCYREAEVRELLELPDDWYTAAAVPIGYPVGGGHGPISRRPLRALAFRGQWGRSWS